MRVKKRSLADHNTMLLNLFALCLGTTFILPVLLPYYRDRIGLDFRDLMIGEAVFSAVVLFCEVPTGWLADHWKRKYVLALAGLAGMAGYALLLLAQNFAMTVLAQGTIGLSVSLVSGTMQALHYDSLLAEGRGGEYRRQEGRRHGLGLLAVGFSSLLGGFLYEQNHALPVVLTIISDIGMIAAALMMREPDRIRTVQKQNPLVVMGQTLKFALHGHREVAEIIFSAAALFGTTKILLWLQQSYYTSIHMEEKWYGVMLACGFLVGSTASQFGHLLDRRFKSRTVLLAMTLGLIIICAASAWLHSLAGAVLLLGGSLFWGAGWPRVQDALNNAVDSARRATVLSAASLMVHAVFVPLGLAVGAVTEHYGPQAALLALIPLPALAVFVLLKMKIRQAAGLKPRAGAADV